MISTLPPARQAWCGVGREPHAADVLHEPTVAAKGDHGATGGRQQLPDELVDQTGAGCPVGLAATATTTGCAAVARELVEREVDRRRRDLGQLAG